MGDEPMRSFMAMDLGFDPPVETPWSGLLNEKDLSRIQIQGIAELYRAITKRGAIVDEHGVFVSQNGLPIYVTVTHGKTILSKPIDVNSSGDNEIVAAVQARRIKVIAFSLQSHGAVDVEWNGFTGAYSFNDREGMSQSIEAPSFLFGTERNEALVLTLSGAVQVTGHVTYFVDDGE